ncbi:MAG: hypothetical protein H7Z14_08250, partial [Anaerolineae bacterium]|nr:hypothetical protein [Phycisphaerae bacterium]
AACDVHGGASDLEITARQTSDGASFVFFWNRSRDQHAKGNVTLRLNGAEQQFQVAYDLSPFDFKLLMLPAGAKDTSNARWLPEPASMPTTRPTVPQPVKILTALHRTDRGEASDWTRHTGGELASASVFDSRYVMFRARPVLTKDQTSDLIELNLELFAPDDVIARINGRIVYPREAGGTRVTIPVQNNLHEGENEIVLLYENAGYGNFGSDTALPAGLKRGVLSRGNHMQFPFEQWAVRSIDGDRFDPALAALGMDDSTWPRFRLNAETARTIDDAPQPGAVDEASRNAARILYDRDNSRAVYRATARFDQAAIDGVRNCDLVFDRIDDEGVVYINGKEAARSTKWNKPCVIPKFGTWLQPGKNVITVQVLNTGGAGGLTRPARFESSVDGLPLEWELSNQLPGIARGWQQSEIVELATWKRIELGNTPREPGALARWYRCEFELPKLDENIWAPWLATIAADGNGMIYLNGHPLGRYWHVGPQRKFFLPECWLKFGAGEKNVLTFCLRDRPESPGVIRSIEVGADADYAERR